MTLCPEKYVLSCAKKSGFCVGFDHISEWVSRVQQTSAPFQHWQISFLRQLQFSCFPWVASQLVVRPCQALRWGVGSLSWLWGWTGWWWEATGAAQSVGSCWQPWVSFPWAMGGAQLLRGHSHGEEICPSLVQGLPFLFPCGETAIHWEKTKGVDISDGSQVTLTRKWGHLSYRISRQLGPFWNLQKAESWRLGAWNAIKFKYGKIYSLWLWYGKTLVPDLKHVGQIVLRFKHVFELFLGINPVSSPSHRSYICRTFWHGRVSPDINVILSRTSLTV